MGASSMFKIDFTKRSITDPDYNRLNPQNEIIIDGIRLDTFIENNNLTNIDMLCMDLQGYELNALKSMGRYLKNIKYIITEASINSTYIGGCSFSELNEYLNSFGFKYNCSDLFQYELPTPNLSTKNFCEFNILFVNMQYK
jgi:hypothetical protein